MSSEVPPRRPGTKRLSVVLSLVAYIICGIPVWWATTSLQRPELPHAEMRRAGALGQADNTMLPVAVHIYMLSGPGGTAHAGSAQELLATVQSRVRAALPDAAAQARLRLTATVESMDGACAHAGGGAQASPDDPGPACLSLGQTREQRPAAPPGPAAVVDDALQAALLRAASSPRPGRYTLFVLPAAAAAGEELEAGGGGGAGGSAAVAAPQVTAGRHRHAWLSVAASVPAAAAAALAGDAAAQLLRSCWALGWDGGPSAAAAAAEQLPLSAAAHAVLSFSLLNADPRGGAVAWDFDALQALVEPALLALCPLAILAVDSQVLHYTPARTNGTWSERHRAHVLRPDQLPFFVDSDWNLLAGRGWDVAGGGGDACDAGAAAHAGKGVCARAPSPPRACLRPGDQLALLQPHVLHFLVYVPPRGQRPLLVLGPEGQPSPSNSFWIPSWGSVIIVNPPETDSPEGKGAEEGSSRVRGELDAAMLSHVAGTVLGGLRALLGLPDVTGAALPSSGTGPALRLLPSPVEGFAQWEVDGLLRLRVAGDVTAVGKVLDSLARIVQELPNLEMPPLIGEQVRQSLDALALARAHIAAGEYYAASAAAQRARAAADAAFLHPAVLAQLNFPQSHKLGIYMPLFLPVTVPLLQGLITEAVRSVRRWRRYRAAVAAAAA